MDRRWWIAAVGLAAVVGAIAIWAASGDDEDDTGSSSSAVSTPATSAEDGTSTSDDLDTDTSTTASTSLTTSTTGPPATETVVPADVPRAVARVRASAGAGSGEVQVDWDGVTGALAATGYRVVRVDASGAGTVMVEIDVVSGTATAEPDVTNVWSDEHRYLPAGDPIVDPDPSTGFHYVDVGGTGERCYQVIAFNAAGAAPPSTVVCAGPP